MDCSNGRIGTKQDLINEGSDPKDLVRIKMADATRKQIKSGRVSMNDRRSALGRVLTKNQAKARRKKMRGKK